MFWKSTFAALLAWFSLNLLLTTLKVSAAKVKKFYTENWKDTYENSDGRPSKNSKWKD